LQQIAATSLSQINKTFQAFYAAGGWDLCSSFNITGAMIGRNITNHRLEKKKVPGFDLFSGKTTFFPVFWL